MKKLIVFVFAMLALASCASQHSGVIIARIEEHRIVIVERVDGMIVEVHGFSVPQYYSEEYEVGDTIEFSCFETADNTYPNCAVP